MDIKTLSLSELNELEASKMQELNALFELETHDEEQLATAESLAAEVKQIREELSSRQTAETARSERLAALRNEFAEGRDDDDESGDDASDDEGDADTEAAADTDAEASTDGAETEAASDAAEAVTASAGSKKRSSKQRLAGRASRPATPAKPETTVTILAAADSGFPAGQPLDIDKMGEALQHRVRAMGKPSAAQRGADIPMQHYPVASINTNAPAELTIDRTSDDMAVLAAAVDQSRLPGGSLVAAGGWCAPSENLYDLCEGETLEGLISVPEVTVNRGGINYTKGPQFQDFYGNGDFTAGQGFLQTEAQAIAGQVKECFTIDCPPFQEVRLDAVGLCIKVPILTEAGYPELVRRITSGSLTAHQHRMSVETIRRMVALTGPAETVTGLGATVTDSLEALEKVADERREQFRFALDHPFEVIMPFWLKAVFRNDLARRSSVATEAISDAQIMAHFAGRNLAVQFVYGWQSLVKGQPYPGAFQALMYPAGTFVVGKAPVINLNAVYDAASLEVNVYTGTFTEQGLLVAEMCFDSDLVEIPICSAGRTGASDLTCVPATAPTTP